MEYAQYSLELFKKYLKGFHKKDFITRNIRGIWVIECRCEGKESKGSQMTFEEIFRYM